jgi:hypothetical protein
MAGSFLGLLYEENLTCVSGRQTFAILEKPAYGAAGFTDSAAREEPAL